MSPSLGRIVLYRLTAEDAEKINRRRAHAATHMDQHRANSNGVMVHVGNVVAFGEEFPLVITRLWGTDPGSAFNGTLLLDGSDTYWVTSTSIFESEGEQPGRLCRWPPRV